MGINKVRKKKKKHGHTRDTLDVDQGLPYTERTSKSNGHCVGKKKIIKNICSQDYISPRNFYSSKKATNKLDNCSIHLRWSEFSY